MHVFGNQTENNNGANGNGHGIALAAGGNNYIFRNTVTHNGLNRSFDSGIYLSFTVDNGIQTTNNNVVESNSVENNCGDGIAVGPNANDNNNILLNTAKFNGLNTREAICDPVTTGDFHDLAQLGSSSNIWNPNNICNTQTANIPAGVCNPGE